MTTACVVACGSPKMFSSTSAILQFVFYFLVSRTGFGSDCIIFWSLFAFNFVLFYNSTITPIVI